MGNNKNRDMQAVKVTQMATQIGKEIEEQRAVGTWGSFNQNTNTVASLIENPCNTHWAGMRSGKGCARLKQDDLRAGCFQFGEGGGG